SFCASGPGSSMQKLSACRKRGSSIHFFSSIMTRCIIAICPAGPPKLMQPIFSQTRKNSPKLGRSVVDDLETLAESTGFPVQEDAVLGPSSLGSAGRPPPAPELKVTQGGICSQRRAKRRRDESRLARGRELG